MFIKTLNIQLARAISLNPYFRRLHTAIEIPFKKSWNPLSINPAYVPDTGHYIFL